MREVGVHVSILATILTSNCKGKQKVIPEKQMQSVPSPQNASLKKIPDAGYRMLGAGDEH